MSEKPELPPLPYQNMGVIISPALHAEITRLYGPKVAAGYIVSKPIPKSNASVYIKTWPAPSVSMRGTAKGRR